MPQLNFSQMRLKYSSFCSLCFIVKSMAEQADTVFAVLPLHYSPTSGAAGTRTQTSSLSLKEPCPSPAIYQLYHMPEPLSRLRPKLCRNAEVPGHRYAC